MSQIRDIDKKFDDVSYTVNRGKIDVFIRLQPTEGSLTYKIKIAARVGSTMVDVFVVDPNVTKLTQKLNIPHLYKNGALCLYYPDYYEWNHTDSWADTLVPWSSLWLYYFEIWLATDEWLGGGIHPGDEKEKRI